MRRRLNRRVILRADSFAAAALMGCLVFGASAFAQQETAAPPETVTDAALLLPSVALAPILPGPTVVPLNEDRIMKVIPDYQTVEDSSQPIAPMTASQKWYLAWKETIDPFNVGTAAMTAAFSQRGNQTPKYGEGWENYGMRYGAALADFGSQNFFSAGLFAVLLHQDPRYFRKGPAAGLFSRVLYSVSRIVICRDDHGHSVLNTSNLLGTAMGIAASNVYYPSASRTGTVMGSRVETSLFGGVMGNLMSEFWPDIQRKFFQKKARK